jgi:hypothetical protein
MANREQIAAIGSKEEKAALIIQEGLIALASSIKYLADALRERSHG